MKLLIRQIARAYRHLFASGAALALASCGTPDSVIQLTNETSAALARVDRDLNERAQFYERSERRYADLIAAYSTRFEKVERVKHENALRFNRTSGASDRGPVYEALLQHRIALMPLQKELDQTTRQLVASRQSISFPRESMRTIQEKFAALLQPKDIEDYVLDLKDFAQEVLPKKDASSVGNIKVETKLSLMIRLFSAIDSALQRIDVSVKGSSVVYKLNGKSLDNADESRIALIILRKIRIQREALRTVWDNRSNFPGPSEGDIDKFRMLIDNVERLSRNNGEANKIIEAIEGAINGAVEFLEKAVVEKTNDSERKEKAKIVENSQ